MTVQIPVTLSQTFSLLLNIQLPLTLFRKIAKIAIKITNVDV